MKKIIERSKMALDGVPQETRRFLPDNNTEFLRVIHGKDRLYPDTDTPPIDMDIDKIQELKGKVQSRPWELEKEFEEKYNLDYNKVKLLIRHNNIELFVNFIEEHKLKPLRCYQFFEETILALKREGLDTNQLTETRMLDLLKGAQNGDYDYNQIPNIARVLIISPNKKIKQALSDLKIAKVLEKDLEKFFNEAYKEFNVSQLIDGKSVSIRKEQVATKITGHIMRRIKGSNSGKSVFNFVTKKLESKGLIL